MTDRDEQALRSAGATDWADRMASGALRDFDGMICDKPNGELCHSMRGSVCAGCLAILLRSVAERQHRATAEVFVRKVRLAVLQRTTGLARTLREMDDDVANGLDAIRNASPPEPDHD